MVSYTSTESLLGIFGWLLPIHSVKWDVESPPARQLVADRGPWEQATCVHQEREKEWPMGLFLPAAVPLVHCNKDGGLKIDAWGPLMSYGGRFLGAK